MALTRDQFSLTDEELKSINDAIAKRVSAIYENNPDEDPLDGVSVLFSFTPGLGRDVEVLLAGQQISIYDMLG